MSSSSSDTLYNYGINDSLVGNDEAMKIIMTELSDADLENFCQTNKSAQRYCNNDLFWKNRLKEKYRETFDDVSPTLPREVPYRILYWVVVEFDKINNYQYPQDTELRLRMTREKFRQFAKRLIHRLQNLTHNQKREIVIYISHFSDDLHYLISIELTKNGDDELALDLMNEYSGDIIILLPYCSITTATEIGRVVLERYSLSEDAEDEEELGPRIVLERVVDRTPIANIIAYSKAANVNLFSCVEFLLIVGRYKLVYEIYKLSNKSIKEFIAETDKMGDPDYFRNLINMIVLYSIPFTYDDILSYSLSDESVYLLESKGIYPTKRYLDAKFIYSENYITAISVLIRNGIEY